MSLEKIAKSFLDAVEERDIDLNDIWSKLFDFCEEITQDDQPEEGPNHPDIDVDLTNMSLKKPSASDISVFMRNIMVGKSLESFLEVKRHGQAQTQTRIAFTRFMKAVASMPVFSRFSEVPLSSELKACMEDYISHGVHKIFQILYLAGCVFKLRVFEEEENPGEEPEFLPVFEKIEGVTPTIPAMPSHVMSSLTSAFKKSIRDQRYKKKSQTSVVKKEPEQEVDKDDGDEDDDEDNNSPAPAPPPATKKRGRGKACTPTSALKKSKGKLVHSGAYTNRDTLNKFFNNKCTFPTDSPASTSSAKGSAAKKSPAPAAPAARAPAARAPAAKKVVAKRTPGGKKK